MTGNEMMKKALVLLGYTDSTGEISGEQRFRSRALTVLNGVYSDLFYIKHRDGFIPLKHITDNIELPERELNDVMPYGVAATNSRFLFRFTIQSVRRLHNPKRWGT